MFLKACVYLLFHVCLFVLFVLVHWIRSSNIYTSIYVTRIKSVLVNSMEYSRPCLTIVLLENKPFVVTRQTIRPFYASFR